MSTTELDELHRLTAELRAAREAFPTRVMHAAVYAMKVSRSVAPAIGEISVGEAIDAIVREFDQHLRAAGLPDAQEGK